MHYTTLCNTVHVSISLFGLSASSVCLLRGGGGWIINAVWSLDPTCSDYWVEHRPFHSPAKLMPLISFRSMGRGVRVVGVGCCSANELENQFLPALPSLYTDLSLSLHPNLLLFFNHRASLQLPCSNVSVAMATWTFQGPRQWREREGEQEEGCKRRGAAHQCLESPFPPPTKHTQRHTHTLQAYCSKNKYHNGLKPKICWRETEIQQQLPR